MSKFVWDRPVLRSFWWTAMFRAGLVICLCFVTWFALGYNSRAVVSMLGNNTSHIIAFFWLALFIDGSFPRLPFWRCKVPILMLYGAGIEVAQGYLSYRVFSYWDLLADVAGILIYGSLRIGYQLSARAIKRRQV